MGLLLHALHAHQPLPDCKLTRALSHYTEQATLAGSGHHVATLIRKHPSYSAQELADIISAVAAHAAHLDKVGMNHFGEVSTLLDKAADLADESYFVPELAR